MGVAETAWMSTLRKPDRAELIANSEPGSLPSTVTKSNGRFVTKVLPRLRAASQFSTVNGPSSFA